MIGKSIEVTTRFLTSKSRYASILKNNFDGYFEGAITNSTAPWITHPFEAKLESIADDDLCKGELIDLQCSTMLHSKFMSRNGDFSKFWCGLVEEFPMLSKACIRSYYTFCNDLSV